MAGVFVGTVIDQSAGVSLIQHEMDFSRAGLLCPNWKNSLYKEIGIDAEQ
jgi:hypothetical protein